MTTYLRDLAQSLGRYGGLLKIIFGFKSFLDAQVLFLLGAEFLASKDGGQAPHVEGSMTIQLLCEYEQHKSLRCLPCPTSTILAYNILMGPHNHKRFLA